MTFWGDLMRDEQGTPSMGRLLATAALVFAGWFTVKAVQGSPVPVQVWDFWLPIVLSLIAWGAGPRMVQYLAPAVSAALQRVRGLVGSSSYSRTEVQEEVKVHDDDPVPPGPVRLE